MLCYSWTDRPPRLRRRRRVRDRRVSEMKVQVVALVAMTFVAIFAALMRTRA
jgi:hypothetical protein